MNGQIIRWVACTLAFVALPSVAEQADEQSLANEQFAKARDELQTGRREIIAEDLRLSDTQGAAFWPLYDEYEQQVLQFRDRYTTAITNYMRRHRAGTISDADAQRFLDEDLAFKQDLLDVRKDYLKKFRRVLPIRKVARFYQLENKLDVEIDAQLAVAIPLMDPV